MSFIANDIISLASINANYFFVFNSSFNIKSQNTFFTINDWEFRIWCERGLLTFSYTDPAVTLYEMGIKAPIRIEPKPCTRNYLSDFYQEIRENTDRLTRNVLISTETALRLQAAADQEAEA